MQQRQLGRTGHMSSVMIFGGAALWKRTQQQANEALDMARAAGVNHIDVAPQYGWAEVLLGSWLPPHRDEFFVGGKTLMRERRDAMQELRQTLDKLSIESLDLYQLHAVRTFEELDRAMEPGGAIEALQEARDLGLTRYLGITGHGLEVAAIQAAALERFDFDTVMFPINPVLYANPTYRRDTEHLLRLCAERGVGVQIIKSIAKGPWGDRERQYDTWYEPYDVQARITEGVHFALSQPAVTAIAAAGDVRLLPMVQQAAETFEPLSEDEQAALINRANELEPLFV